MKRKFIPLLSLLAGVILSATIYAGSGIFDIPHDDFFDSWLTPEQEAQALQQIDNICGDTWCEGDHNFGFDHLRCLKEQGVCLLEFRIIDRVDHYDTDLTIVSRAQDYRAGRIPTEKHHRVECRIAGIQEFSDILQSEYRLNDRFYDILTRCMNDLEDACKK